MPSVYGGINKGLIQGLQLGNMFSQGKERKSDKEKEERAEERRVIQDKRRALMQTISAAGATLKVEGLPDQVYLDHTNILLSAVGEITGKKVIEVDRFNNSLKPFAIRTTALFDKYNKNQISKSVLMQSLAEEYDDFLSDPNKKPLYERFEKDAKETQKLQLDADVQRMLRAVGNPDANQDPEVLKAVRRGAANPAYGKKLADATEIARGKKKPDDVKSVGDYIKLRVKEIMKDGKTPQIQALETALKEAEVKFPGGESETLQIFRGLGILPPRGDTGTTPVNIPNKGKAGEPFLNPDQKELDKLINQ